MIGDDGEVLAGGERIVEIRRMAEERDELADILALADEIEPAYARRTAVRTDGCGDRSQQRRLSRSVRAGQHQHGAAREIERDIRQRPPASIPAGKLLCFDVGGVSHARAVSFRSGCRARTHPLRGHVFAVTSED